MSVIDMGRLQRQLDGAAKRAGNVMRDLIGLATLAYVNGTSPKVIKLMRERMERHASKGTIDPAFAIAKLIAPRVEDVIKACATHDDAVAQSMAQVDRLRAEHGGWKSLKDALNPATSAPKVEAVQPATSVPVDEAAEEVANAAPASTPMERFVALLDGYDWSADDLASMAKAINDRLLAAQSLKLAA